METITIKETFYDTPDRSTTEEIERDVKLFKNNNLINQLLEGFPDLVVILNWNRQIVAYNSKAVNILHPSDKGTIYGQRIGEALRCIHAFEMPAGCGTSKFCTECGAGKCNKYSRESMLNCSGECRITVDTGKGEAALNLKVFSSLLHIDNKYYTLFSIKNIEDEKKRRMLERIFFHDVLNTASAINGIATILPQIQDPDEFNEFSQMLLTSSNQLISEIQFQRDLLYAENGNLEVNPKPVSINSIITKVKEIYLDHEVAKGKTIEVKPLEKDAVIETEENLLLRSLGNLVKNALEAVKDGEPVIVYADQTNDSIYLNVKNNGVIPLNIQMQIFQRSFSTKGNYGRGIGTYSVKLFVEQYLGGKVYFVSNKMLQTIFTIEIPKIFSAVEKVN